MGRQQRRSGRSVHAVVHAWQRAEKLASTPGMRGLVSTLATRRSARPLCIPSVTHARW